MKIPNGIQKVTQKTDSAGDLPTLCQRGQAEMVIFIHLKVFRNLRNFLLDFFDR